MKKVVLVLMAVAFPALMMAQNDAIDKLFKKYGGKEGVTTVNISPELFQVMKGMEIQDMGDQDIPLEKITGVRVLTIEDEGAFPGANFYEEIKNDLDVSNMAEVMTVNDGGEMVRMWMRTDQSKVQEFLLIVAGDDNVLVHITGNFNMDDLEGMAESFGEDIDIDF